MNEKIKKIKKLQINIGLKIRDRTKRFKDQFKELKRKIPEPVVKQTIKVVKPIFNVNKKLWGFLDGKKTVLGLITTGVGVGMYYVPVLSFFATETLAAGIGTLATGIGFKIKKGNKDKVVKFLVELLKKKK
jgi:hypothetical protein